MEYKTIDEIKKAHPDWKLVISSDNMDEVINCANCGKKLTFGESYTGIYETTSNGIFGLPVCEDCYFNKEFTK